MNLNRATLQRERLVQRRTFPCFPGILVFGKLLEKKIGCERCARSVFVNLLLMASTIWSQRI